MKKQIGSQLAKITEEIPVERIEIDTQVQGSAHGDYSTNIALVAYPKLKKKFKNPLELATYLLKQLQKKVPEIEKIEVSAPGFINFWLKDTALLKNLEEVIDKKEDYGKGERLKNLPDGKAGKKIMLEFADPNPFKEFHIGHLRNISLGESYARLMEFEGGEVFRVNYQGDVGMHVAKALYGLLQISNLPAGKAGLKSRAAGKAFGDARQISNLEKKPISERSKFLGESYALGSKMFDEDEKSQKEIKDLNIKIYQKDSSIKEIWEKGRQWSLLHFEEIYKRVGTHYKRYYFEGEVAQKGREIVLSHIKDGIFEKHKGAVVFRGDHTRVFVTSENYATYEAKDLALSKLKYQDFAYDQSIIITANEQNAYFKVVLDALGKVFPDLASKTTHRSFGFVNLKEGKMSSRLGGAISAEWLLDMAKNKIKEKFRDLDEEILEKVAVGAVKYSMLKFSRTSDILFSFEESISLEGNSGPYLQYTYARTQSVLRKVKSVILSKTKDLDSSATPQNDRISSEELLILRLLIHFTEIVEEAEKNFAPNLLCNYLFELSQKFNNFYQKHKILQSKNQEFRLALTSSVGQVLKTGLYLLGIETPEKM